jgi:signal transduction histidine kinase/ActR/RegA family two-component response regulator
MRVRLTVGERLGIAFGALLAIAAVEAALALHWVGRIGALRRELEEVIAPRDRAADLLERSILRRAVALRNFAITANPAQAAAADEAWAAARAALEDVTRRVAPEERALVAAIAPAAEVYGRAGEDFARAVVRLPRPERERAEEALSADRERLFLLVREYASRQEGARTRAAARIAEAERGLASGARWLVVAMGAGLAAAGWWVLRSIRTPVGRLAHAAEALGAGDPGPALALAPPDAPAGRGELAALAQGFSRMARDLAEREARLVAQHGELQAQHEELQAQQEELQAQGEELRTQAGELVEQNERLRSAAEALEAADRRKDEFLATLGHELRNPLAAIFSSAQLLPFRSGDPDAVARLGEVLTRQARHLARLVDDLLDVSRITQGKLELRREDLDLRAAVRNAVEVCRPEAERRSQEIAVALPDAPATVHGDPARLEQIVQNLLHNASKFSPAGARLRVALEADAVHATVRVEDPGEGIPPDLLPRVFDLFVQGASPGGAREGLGIGLTLVRQLAALHGGRVEARSDGPGRGSTFVVTLPLARPREAAGPAPAAAPDARRLRVLVFEDNRDLADTTRAVLELWGHEVEVAPTGREGVERARATRPDVLLVDIGLPDMTGYDVARAVRAAVDGAPRPRLVALTGFGLAADRARASAEGFEAHLVKPVEPEALRRTLAELAAGAGEGAASA